MFESDDFDQILSQFDFPEVTASHNLSVSNHGDDKNKNKTAENSTPFSISNAMLEPETKANPETINESPKVIKVANSDKTLISPKHTKRKMLDRYFDQKSKRKFPGPAGLLTGNLKENKDEHVCGMELLSQDVDFSQHNIHKDAFDSELWHRLIEDVKDWNLCAVDTIKAIKQCTIAGNLRKKKAQTVIAFVETVDRSITDPLITLRDSTGTIKCTLHRDAWSTFSPYIVAEYCALVLYKPTILTTGSTFKKHYLNITLSNIFAIYSSAILEDNAIKDLPEGYVKINECDYTVIKANEQSWKSGLNRSIIESALETHTDLEGLENIFSDEIF